MSILTELKESSTNWIVYMRCKRCKSPLSYVVTFQPDVQNAINNAIPQATYVHGGNHDGMNCNATNPNDYDGFSAVQIG